MKTLILFLLSGTITAQTLISNPSFEDYTSIPIQSGEFDKSIDWKCSGGSPDYFHEFSATSSGVNIPYTFAGDIPSAYEGMACMGVITYMKGVTDYREYLTQKLAVPLVAGKTYQLSMQVLTNQNPILYGGLTATDFGIAFSKTKMMNYNSSVINLTPQCVYPGLLYAYQWKQLNFQFTADSNYKYMIIGCFVNDSVQQRQPIAPAVLFECVYTFIDDINLQEVVVSGMDELGRAAAIKMVKCNLLGQRVR